MRLKSDSWLLNIPIAHRGLWGEKIVENSLSAYKNAIEKGYPIEIDVYSSVDGELFCFHDQDLERMTGQKGYIYQKTAKEILSLKLNGCDERIPTFDEVLSVVNAKVPLLIELKDQPNSDFVDKVINRLKSYKGEFAIQSFNPLYIKRVKKLAPFFLRGILGTKTYSKHLRFIKRFIVKNMNLNFLIKPDFISYSFEDLPLKKRKTKNIPVITWTITSEKDYQKIKPFAKNIIFENFIPTKQKKN